MNPKEIIEKLERGELDQPDVLSDYVVIFSASLQTAMDSELTTKIAYAKKWEEFRKGEKTDKACDMAIMKTDEFRLKEQAKNQIKVLESCILALKKKLSHLSFEYKSGQNYGR